MKRHSWYRNLRQWGLAVFVTIGSGGAFAQSTAAVGDAGAKIESELIQTLQTKGTSAFYVHFEQKADLSSVYGFAMTWEERGQYVYDTLRATAQSSQAEAQQLLAAAGLKSTSFFVGNLLYVERADLAVAQALARLPGVTALKLPRTFEIDLPIIGGGADISNQPAGSLAWGIVDTNADAFWSTYAKEGEGIVVANIDTGVQWNHPALVNAFKCGSAAADPTCWADPSNICGSAGACDNNGHGTHTMGTMVGANDSSLAWQAGMAPGAKWIACKGCESNSCSDLALNTCADWLLAPGGNTANRPHVVNNSWGGDGGNTWYQSKVDAWRAAGIFPAFSAGNDGSNGCGSLGSPGDYQASFASAAHDSARAIAYFSSRGPSAFGHDPYTKANISAPGVNVCSSLPGDSWSCDYSGTSMASPHSAGAVALLWSCNPNLIGQIDQTVQALQGNADTPPAGDCGAPPEGPGNYTYGYGYLNVLAAGGLVCSDPPAGKLVLNPTSLAATVTLGKSRTLPLDLSNTGGQTLNFAITEQSVTASAQMTGTAKIAIPTFTGLIPVSEVPASTGPAPRDAIKDLSAAAPAPAQPLGTLSGAPAFAMDVYPGENLVSIPSVDVPGTWNVIANKPGTSYLAGDFIGGDFTKLYALDYATNQLHSLDTVTGATTVIAAAAPIAGETWTGMSGGSNGVMYASGSVCGSSSTLYSVNLTTGEPTVIGPITNGPCIIDIAMSPDNTFIYGVDIMNNVLVRIDPATAAGTVVGSVGVDANYAQGMDFDDASGILYWAAWTSDSGAGEMRVIDITTGNSALVGAFPGGAETDVLAIATGGVVDVPWLSESPTSGVLAPTAHQVVNVTFDAGVDGMTVGVYQSKLNVRTDTPDGTLSVPVELTVVDAVVADFVVDFGSTGLWLYTLNDLGATSNDPDATIDGAWDRIHDGNAEGLAGWSGGLAVDLGTKGLWNYNGATWKKVYPLSPINGGLANWAGGLAVDFGTKVLVNYDGKSLKWLHTGMSGKGVMAGWSKGLAVDLGPSGLWNYNGTTWARINVNRPDVRGLAAWSGGLAADFGGTKGLWSYDGTDWKSIHTGNPGDGGIAGWTNGLVADFDSNGLWNYDGTTWTKLSAWNAGKGGVSEWSGGLMVDFDGRGLWNFDGEVWRRLISGIDAEALSAVSWPGK
ncbi:S8 family serine peptidase [Lamprocystis purpurea]|jgi:hypothetical protein|uniref:S8 family serine peptidase n=1 Tax=Lamprocystis purpurea TaxID=61598 RepID=UPI0003998D25|nr:S8 family serine peptidase [Lamprocystis purpurea]